MLFYGALFILHSLYFALSSLLTETISKLASYILAGHNYSEHANNAYPLPN